MRLLRIGEPGYERPAVLDGTGKPRDLSGIVDDIDGAALADMSWTEGLDPGTLPGLPEDDRVGPCVANVSKIVAVGLNYSDHAAESGLPIPPEPILFMKATSAISGPYDDVMLPRGSTRTDWEVELGFVIGKRASYIEVENAMDHVAGFCIVNDVSEREFQIEMSGQWVKGKSADTFAPVGPWLVTPDEIPDLTDLNLWLEIDGKRVQDSSTRFMIFDVPFLVSYISRFMSLLPGDIVVTGTPPGVGLGMKPPRYLSAGQTMRLGIDGLGEQFQRVVDWKKA